MKFYVAYAIRRFVTPKDIVKDMCFEDYSEAEKQAGKILFDDDDSGVFAKYEGEWYRIFGKDNNGYQAHKVKDGWDAKNIIIKA